VTFRGQEVSPGEVFKRVLLAGIDPFRVFADVARRPDTAGAFACMLLLAFAHFLSNSVLAAKVVVYAGKGEKIAPPAVTVDGSVRKVVAVNATSYRRLGPVSEEQYAALNMLALGYALTTWVAWALGLWLAYKLAGGSPSPAVLMSGYVLSSKVYENLTRAALLAMFLRDLGRIELYVEPSQGAQRVGALLNLASAAFTTVEGLPTAVAVHAAFFTVWSAVVATAAVNRGGLTSLPRSIAAGLAAYVLASAIQSLAYSALMLAL
jgi:hypothetical protein